MEMREERSRQIQTMELAFIFLFFSVRENPSNFMSLSVRFMFSLGRFFSWILKQLWESGKKEAMESRENKSIMLASKFLVEHDRMIIFCGVLLMAHEAEGVCGRGSMVCFCYRDRWAEFDNSKRHVFIFAHLIKYRLKMVHPTPCRSHSQQLL